MLEQIKNINNLDELQKLYSDTFGKTGTMTARLKTIKDMSNDDRVKINLERDELQTAFKTRQTELENAMILAVLAKDKLDPAAETRPRAVLPAGKIHPVTRVLTEMVAILTDMGYGLRTGPEIEDDWHNFTALNTPPNHPARDMQDTFWLANGNALRTQTSSIQIRSMEVEGVPIKIFGIGPTYRRDMDSTHVPSFRQIETLNIGENITMANLIGDAKKFIETFFGRAFNMRIRPSYFPFTEPSIEIDIEWRPGKWLELGGAGMVHPNVLKNCGIDPEQYQGFAWGWGWDRMAMMKYGLPDMRKFFDGDIRWLKGE